MLSPCQRWRPEFAAHSRCPRWFRKGTVAFLSVASRDSTGNVRYPASQANRLPPELTELVLELLAVAQERNYASPRPRRDWECESRGGFTCALADLDGNLVAYNGTSLCYFSSKGTVGHVVQRPGVRSAAINTAGDLAWADGSRITVERAAGGRPVVLEPPSIVELDSSSSDDEYTMKANPVSLTWDREGRLVAADENQRRLHAFTSDNLLHGTLQHFTGTGSRPIALAARWDGGFLVASLMYGWRPLGAVRIVGPQGATVRVVRLPETLADTPVRCVAVDPAGNSVIVVTNLGDAEVIVLAADSDEVLFRCKEGGEPRGVAVLGDGSIALVTRSKVFLV